ncbi:unnamed protein product [Phaedon cochleariae]|uniref:Myb/SANT-like DNA-binding domain-containing protein n=1 Tax=Phaedon cochleariae TaxID=80249 RepID=A0A9P0DVX0_PHACE|nr:unnamed protein product [Phaedon cochleariae]
MNREPLNGEIIKTDDGQYIRYNTQIGCYELLEGNQPLLTAQLTDPVAVGSSTPNIDEDEPDASDADMLKKRRLWDFATTLLMMDECTTFKKELLDPKMKNTAIYKKITKKMAEHGHNVTPEQIHNRMKTLINKYEEVRDHNNARGSSFKDWEYYEILENYMGQTPNITPIASCSSLEKNIMNAINAKIPVKKKQQNSESGPSSTIPNCSPLHSRNTTDVTTNNVASTESPKQAKRFRPSPRVEMIAFLKDYKEDMKKREVERMKMMQQHHEENKEMVSELISLLKETKQE